MATVKENILNSLGWFYEDLEKYALDDINKSIEAEATARENADTDLKDNYIPEYAKDNTWLLAGGEEISNESDLDDYMEQGNYYCRSNTNAKTLLNCPVVYAFTMKVFPGVGRRGTTSVYMTQRLETYNITSIYERYYSSDSNKWLSWHQVPFMDDVESAVEAEAKTRENADTSLQTSIDTESKTRESADTSLTDSVNAITSSSAYTWAEDTSTKDILVWQRQLTASDDLDNVLEAGMYYASTGDIPANSPYSNAFVLIVFALNSRTTRMVQLCFRYGSAGYMSFRPLTGSSWLSWKSVALSDDVDSAVDTITSSSAYTWANETRSKQIMTGNSTALTSSDNLDNVLTAGIYWASTDSIPKNSPYDNAYILEVIKPDSSTTNRTLQVATRYGTDGYMAFRVLSDSWGEWRYVVNSTTSSSRPVDMERGYYTFSGGDIPANGYCDIAITYSNTFPATPYVFTTICNAGTSSNSISGYPDMAAVPRDQSQTGFTLRMLNGSSNANMAPRVNWFAIYV